LNISGLGQQGQKKGTAEAEDEFLHFSSK
jgi:hypothetical protein